MWIDHYTPDRTHCRFWTYKPVTDLHRQILDPAHPGPIVFNFIQFSEKKLAEYVGAPISLRNPVSAAATPPPPTNHLYIPRASHSPLDSKKKKRPWQSWVYRSWLFFHHQNLLVLSNSNRQTPIFVAPHSYDTRVSCRCEWSLTMSIKHDNHEAMWETMHACFGFRLTLTILDN